MLPAVKVGARAKDRKGGRRDRATWRGGVIIDLSQSPLTRKDLGSIRKLVRRVRGTGSRVRKIRVID
jgi:hypothetical protein